MPRKRKNVHSAPETNGESTSTNQKTIEEFLYESRVKSSALFAGSAKQVPQLEETAEELKIRSKVRLQVFQMQSIKLNDLIITE